MEVFTQFRREVTSQDVMGPNLLPSLIFTSFDGVTSRGNVDLSTHYETWSFWMKTEGGPLSPEEVTYLSNITNTNPELLNYMTGGYCWQTEPSQLV